MNHGFCILLQHVERRRSARRYGPRNGPPEISLHGASTAGNGWTGNDAPRVLQQVVISGTSPHRAARRWLQHVTVFKGSLPLFNELYVNVSELVQSWGPVTSVLHGGISSSPLTTQGRYVYFFLTDVCNADDSCLRLAPNINASRSFRLSLALS